MNRGGLTAILKIRHIVELSEICVSAFYDSGVHLSHLG